MSDAPKDNLETLAELVLTEMLARVKENPGDVSTPVLSRLATDLNRFIERRVKDEEEEEHKPFSLKDELKSLPAHRAKTLVVEEVSRLRGELVFYEGWLDEAGSMPDRQKREGEH